MIKISFKQAYSQMRKTAANFCIVPDGKIDPIDELLPNFLEEYEAELKAKQNQSAQPTPKPRPVQKKPAATRPKLRLTSNNSAARPKVQSTSPTVPSTSAVNATVNKPNPAPAASTSIQPYNYDYTDINRNLGTAADNGMSAYKGNIRGANGLYTDSNGMLRGKLRFGSDGKPLRLQTGVAQWSPKFVRPGSYLSTFDTQKLPRTTVMSGEYINTPKERRIGHSYVSEEDPLKQQMTDQTLNNINTATVDQYTNENSNGAVSSSNIEMYKNWANSQLGPWRRYNFSTTGDKNNGANNPLPKPELPQELKNDPYINKMHNEIGDQMAYNPMNNGNTPQVVG